MNAHHQKRSHRPTAPVAHSFISTGELALSPGAPSSPATLDLQASARIWKAVARTPFGVQLDAIVPMVGGSSGLAEHLEEIVPAEAGFSHCTAVSLADLLVPEFMQDFVRKGSLVALSLEDGEGEDVVCIDGRGRMVLTVSKDTYELLGLPGRPSAFGALGQRFVIEINLRDRAFRAGKTGFERTKRLLRDWPCRVDLFDELLGLPVVGARKTFEMIFVFVDENNRPQPITFPSTVSSSRRTPTLTSTLLRAIRVPTLSFFLPSPVPTTRAKRPRLASKRSGDIVVEWHAQAGELREWLGRVAVAEDAQELSIKEPGSEDEDDDFEDFGVPREQCEEGDARFLSWGGFFHPAVVASLIVATERYPSNSVPFTSFSLHCAPHAPLSHLSAQPPVPATRKKPNGKNIKRGRGRGEEEEGKGEGEGTGWELVLVRRSAPGNGPRWCLWENV